MNEPQEPARTLGDRLVRGALFPLRVTKNSARLIRSALMGDFLTAYSLTQPDKLAMIDDRPEGVTERTWQAVVMAMGEGEDESGMRQKCAAARVALALAERMRVMR